MNKVALFLLLFVISSVGVYAQTDSSSDSADQTTTQRLENARELIKSRREILKDTISEQKETFKDRVKQAREALQTRIKADRAAFQQSLLAIKDQNKQNTVERIDAKISSINTKHTDRLVDGLDKLQAIKTKHIHSVMQTQDDLIKNIHKSDEVILEILRKGKVLWGHQIIVEAIGKAVKL